MQEACGFQVKDKVVFGAAVIVVVQEVVTEAWLEVTWHVGHSTSLSTMAIRVSGVDRG